MPALTSGRTFNLVVWGILTGLFGLRVLKPSTLDTLFISIRALFSISARYRLLRARRPPPPNEWIFEQVQNKETVLGEVTVDAREPPKTYRMPRKFYTVLKGLSSIAFGTKGTNIMGEKISWIVVALISAFAITMTELELQLNRLAPPEEGQDEWGFGQVRILQRLQRAPNPHWLLQILPLLMTIQPIISLIQVLLNKGTGGPGVYSTTIRLKIHRADDLSFRNGDIPSAFCVITCDDQLYSTYEIPQDKNPDWNEAFDVTVTDMTPVVVRVFHLHRKKVPILLGHTTFLPLDLLATASSRKLAHASTHPQNASSRRLIEYPPNSQATTFIPKGARAASTAQLSDGGGVQAEVEGTLELDPRPLWKDGSVVSNSLLYCSLSEDISTPIPLPPPPEEVQWLAEAPSRRRDVETSGFYFKIGYGRFSKTWYKRTDRSRVRV